MRRMLQPYNKENMHCLNNQLNAFPMQLYATYGNIVLSYF